MEIMEADRAYEHFLDHYELVHTPITANVFMARYKDGPDAEMPLLPEGHAFLADALRGETIHEICAQLPDIEAEIEGRANCETCRTGEPHLCSAEDCGPGGCSECVCDYCDRPLVYHHGIQTFQICFNCPEEED